MLMMEPISKTEFKAHALEILRNIEQSGQPRTITDHGKPTLEIKKLRQQKESPLVVLKGTVIKYEAATVPITDDDWENA
ncbi:MAG: type II toxin-antitoxin system Phd/YefM family antitoxin [Gammaproteobacteria bacterium]|nr:MAG: type II toxin-antitoxin system Phd/YefM family antitoxin [Gammaproteobacteria bacterium]